MENPGVICLKSELDLFNGVPLQMGIDSSSFVEIHPVSSISEKNPIEFYISGSGEHYLDLAYTILHTRIKITKKNGADLAATDHVAPINYILNTLFSECAIFLNDKQVASQGNYSYRALLESLLFYSKSGQDSLLSTALFVKDTASHHDVVGDASTNAGFVSRANPCKTSKSLDLVGALHFDLATQQKLLISGVDVRIKLERNKDIFVLMSANDNFKINIQLAKLYVRKVNVSPSIQIAHEKALEMGVIKMPIRRVDVKSFAISSGLQSTTISNAFIGQLPTRLILGFVSNAAYNGSINKNPFKFDHYNLNYLCILNGNQMIPSKPYQPDFEKDLYARSYLSLFTDLNRYHNSPNVNINFEEYKGGYTLYAVDLTPDMASNESHSSINKSGNIAIDIKFGAALAETATLIVYAEYRNIIEIDKSRGVTTDY
jgi:hypothetical protein